MRLLSLQELQSTNLDRCQKWHSNGITDWSALEWAGAMCGEAGEAANVAKKMKRIESGAFGNAHSDHVIGTDTPDDEYDLLIEELGNECADTLLYMCLLCSRHSIDLATAVRQRFNRKSEQMGFPERL